MADVFPRDRVFTVNEDHLKLAREMWVEYEDMIEFGAPAIDPKRPYGNGDVYADMRRILGREAPDDDHDGLVGDEDGLLLLHREMVTVIQIALRTGSFEVGTYNARRYFEDWRRA